MQPLVLADLPPGPSKKGGCAVGEGIGGVALLLLALALAAAGRVARRRPA